MRGRQISKQTKEKIDKMSKARLGAYILKAPKNSGGFRYAIQKFVKKRK